MTEQDKRYHRSVMAIDDLKKILTLCREIPEHPPSEDMIRRRVLTDALVEVEVAVMDFRRNM